MIIEVAEELVRAAIRWLSKVAIATLGRATYDWLLNSFGPKIAGYAQALVPAFWYAWVFYLLNGRRGTWGAIPPAALTALILQVLYLYIFSRLPRAPGVTHRFLANGSAQITLPTLPERMGHAATLILAAVLPFSVAIMVNELGLAAGLHAALEAVPCFWMYILLMGCLFLVIAVAVLLPPYLTVTMLGRLGVDINKSFNLAGVVLALCGAGLCYLLVFGKVVHPPAPESLYGRLTSECSRLFPDTTTQRPAAKR